MPRKQNGFGTTESFAFKGFGRLDKGKGTGAAGYYPGDRQFGSIVQRSVIEKWNLDSDWVKWRKGFEIYSNAGWNDLKVKDPTYDPGLPRTTGNQPFKKALITSTLFKGKGYEIDNTYTGYEYPTANADTNTYYVIKKTQEYKNLGSITSVQNNELAYQANKANNEIHVTINPDSTNKLLLPQLIGERIADGAMTVNGRTEATLKNVLTANGLPSIFKGKTLTKELEAAINLAQNLTTVSVSIPVSDVAVTQNSGTFVPNQGINSQTKQVETLDILSNPSLLDGKITYITNFFIEKAISSLDSAVYIDDDYFFELSIEEQETAQALVALDQGVNELPPAMLDLTTLPTIFTTSNATYNVRGSYAFRKSDYQKYFPGIYITGDFISPKVQNISYSLLPFVIRKADIVNNNLIFEAVPYSAEINLYPDLDNGTVLVFADNSFAKTFTTNTKWTNLDTDVNPWMDEVFNLGTPLTPTNSFTCSCPNHSQSLLSMPQSNQDPDKRKTNRQLRYPLPTAQGQDDYGISGQTQAAGKVSSWESESHRLGFKMCKHTIASMFNEDIRVKEPNKYPTAEVRAKFDEKLEKEIDASYANFNKSYTRTGISISEIVFSLSKGLNLDSTKTAYMVFDSK